MRRFRLLLAGAVVSVVAATVVSGCGSSSAASSGSLKVVAAENFWGNIVSQIGGSAVSVSSIVSDPNVDPHEYESNPSQAAAIASAGLVIVNGAGYDDFATKIMAASPDSKRQVITVADVVGATGDDVNPHLWYNPVYVAQAANTFEQKLAALRPADASTFTLNLKTFLAAYQADVVTVIDQIKNKYAGTAIAYTERVPGYLILAAGLTLGIPASFAQSIEDGNDPSPSDEAAFESALTSHSVKVLLYNQQVTSPATTHIRSLATSAGVPVVGVTETMPPNAASFQAWQQDQAKQILAALGG